MSKWTEVDIQTLGTKRSSLSAYLMRFRLEWAVLAISLRTLYL